MNSDVDEIVRLFVETLPGMVRNRNIDGYVGLFTEDAAWCPPNAPDRFGHEAIHAGVTAILANQDIDPIFTADEALVDGNNGYVLGSSAETLIPHDGGPQTVAYSREIWLFQRSSDSAPFKIARLIFNLKTDKAQLGDGPDSACRVSPQT